ncbi:helix-turn-helix domain-containing protein [Herbiconiux sp. CPCC 203407]|uniref:Helix-turn-helix domain-containing protein n=1 Tax=Herbiconiux oxytropis TaxID=2970915 RepID=A0AA41XE77_9MICO|nr:helix-turn-helix domain-containing protein [Herbiconiux oxytropis]MCS5723465.1 helix-turn-helix domain-containing protein [Herbiconiux oxytropis]MCS5726552.1 helix-turn-helix domain-containing protein [Herbiconiux oxytropis]
MSATLLSNGTVLVDDDLRHQAETLVAEARDRTLTGLFVALDDGQQIRVSADLGRFFVGVLERLAHGPVSVTTLPDALTTTTAAEMLGISRPTLMKLVAAGDIASTKVGSHTRLATADVLELKKIRDHRRAASFDALRAVDDEIDDLGDISNGV